MRAICLHFQIHQPLRLRNYRFFDIGNENYYYDDSSNAEILRKVADSCYLPANKLVLKLIDQFRGKFKVTFSISGTALDQFAKYAPEVIESFQDLAQTGCVEFISETYSHSLSILKDKEEFKYQVEAHAFKIEKLFGQRPTVFRNTELIYSNEIGEIVAEMGFKTILTEGAKQVLRWKSPNYMYANAANTDLKVLMKNSQLSDDIAFRFSDRNWSEWPLTSSKYVSWLNQIDPSEEIINLFMSYETFGERQNAESGIFDFLKYFPSEVFYHSDFNFMTPSDVTELFKPVSIINVPHPISQADEERDLSAWLGNDMQNEAFNKLYDLSELINKCSDRKIYRDWLYLQTSDHFYYMCTKNYTDGGVHASFNPFETPYDAFINYMNILNDFSIRLRDAVAHEEEQFVLFEENDFEQEELVLVEV